MGRGRETKEARSRVALRDGTIVLGRWLAVGFHRTLRVPDDGAVYPLPPSFGRFPVYPAAAYRRRVPPSWNRPGSFFIPLHQREALWLGFEGAPWHPTALVIGADGVNVTTGEPWNAPLNDRPQNYVVAPDQPWLDGIRTKAGLVRQFVAMQLGEGFTLAEQVRHRSNNEGIQLRAHEAKPARFPKKPPAERADVHPPGIVRSPMGGPAIGVAAGGMICQKIYPDRHGIGTWQADEAARAQVYIVNSAQFSAITAGPPPPSPVSAATYTEHGFPWFELWEEELGDLGSQAALEEIKSVGAVDPASKELSVNIREEQIKKIGGVRPVPPRHR